MKEQADLPIVTAGLMHIINIGRMNRKQSWRQFLDQNHFGKFGAGRGLL